jgi:hypothetical protein
MYTKEINCGGCFGIIILFFLLSFFIKLWVFILPLIFILLFVNLLPVIKNKLAKILRREKKFKVKYGVVYKQCQYCGTKADKNVTICPVCKKSY